LWVDVRDDGDPKLCYFFVALDYTLFECVVILSVDSQYYIGQQNLSCL